MTCPAPRPSSFNWPGQDPSLDHLTDLTPPYTYNALHQLTPPYTTFHTLHYHTPSLKQLKLSYHLTPPYTPLQNLTLPHATFHNHSGRKNKDMKSVCYCSTLLHHRNFFKSSNFLCNKFTFLTTSGGSQATNDSPDRSNVMDY